MKISVTETTTLLGNIISERKYNLQKDDIEIENLKSRNSSNEWGILGFMYFDECNHTKYGYRVTKVELYNPTTKELIKREYSFI